MLNSLLFYRESESDLRLALGEPPVRCFQFKRHLAGPFPIYHINR